MPKRPSVMVFEDDFLLAEALADVLSKLGCRVTASAANFDQAMLMASTEDCDLAIVDIDLRGVLAYPVLDRLQDRGISFLMATGAAPSEIPARHAHAPRLDKPYDMHQLDRATRPFRQPRIVQTDML